MDPKELPMHGYLKEMPGLLDELKDMRHRGEDLEPILFKRPELRCYLRLLDGDAEAENDLLFLTRYGNADASMILAMWCIESDPEKAAVLLVQPARMGYPGAEEALKGLADKGIQNATRCYDALMGRF